MRDDLHIDICWDTASVAALPNISKRELTRIYESRDRECSDHQVKEADKDDF